MKKLLLELGAVSIATLPILTVVSCSTNSLPLEVSEFFAKIINANSKVMDSDLSAAKLLVKNYAKSIRKIDVNNNNAAENMVQLANNSSEAFKFFYFPKGIEQIDPFTAQVQILSAKENVEKENAKIILEIRVMYNKQGESKKYYSNTKNIVINFWG